MEITLETVVFYFLAAFIAVFSILTVTTNRIVRAATYLLFVHLLAVRIVRHGRILFPAGIYIPWFSTNHGLCRGRRRALRILHFPDQW